jgi:hypothetical protein
MHASQQSFTADFPVIYFGLSLVSDVYIAVLISHELPRNLRLAPSMGPNTVDMGTSYKEPGVRWRTGYLATEQSDATIEDWLPGYRAAQTQQ